MVCSERFAVGGMGLWRIGILCMGCMKEKSAGVEVFVVMVEGSGRGASELLLSEQVGKTISFWCFTCLAIIASRRSLLVRDQHPAQYESAVTANAGNR